MRKIIITTTKIVHVQVLPDISEGRRQAIEKRQAEIGRWRAKRKRIQAWWKTRRKTLELKGGTSNEKTIT